MNIAVRRKTVDHINQMNIRVSKKLNQTKCTVPSVNDLVKHNEKYEKLKHVTSVKYTAQASPREDPLVQVKKNFEMATTDRFSARSRQHVTLSKMAHSARNSIF